MGNGEVAHSSTGSAAPGILPSENWALLPVSPFYVDNQREEFRFGSSWKRILNEN
jgi:hypothetical protein